MLFGRTENLELKIDAMRNQIDKINGLAVDEVQRTTILEENVRNRLSQGDGIDSKLDMIRYYMSMLETVDYHTMKMDGKLDHINQIEMA